MTTDEQPSSFPAKSLNPPYYSVIFTSARKPQPNDGYESMASRMDELASQQDGYLGIESVGAPGDRPGEVKSITISYWTTEKSMRAWKRNLEHLGAQKKGKVEWYDRYEVRIGFVERAYSFDRAKDREGGGCD